MNETTPKTTPWDTMEISYLLTEPVDYGFAIEYLRSYKLPVNWELIYPDDSLDDTETNCIYFIVKGLITLGEGEKVKKTLSEMIEAYKEEQA